MCKMCENDIAEIKALLLFAFELNVFKYILKTHKNVVVSFPLLFLSKCNFDASTYFTLKVLMGCFFMVHCWQNGNYNNLFIFLNVHD